MTFATVKTAGTHPAHRAGLVLEEYVTLLGKYAVDRMLFDMVKASFNDICPCLRKGVEYSAQDLIGFELWADMTLFARRKAHLCLKHIAALPGSGLTDMASEDSSKATFQLVD